MIDVQAGIQWPDLLAFLRRQPGREGSGAFGRSRPGADRLTHRRRARRQRARTRADVQPFVGDVESFTLVDAAATLGTAAATENAELFRLVDRRLRPVRRRHLGAAAPRPAAQGASGWSRCSEIDELVERFDERIADGYLYGDFQFATDADVATTSCAAASSRATARSTTTTPMPRQPDASRATTGASCSTSHTRQEAGLRRCTPSTTCATSGQIYWSDTHQLSVYVDDYHARSIGAAARACRDRR